MEYIVGLVVIVVVGLLWHTNRKNKLQEVAFKPEPVPYKMETPEPQVETPTAKTCGCGRSPSGFCEGLHALSAEAWATHPDNPAKVVEQPAVEQPVVAEAKKPAKKPAKKAAPKAKPAAKKAVESKAKPAKTAKKTSKK